MHDSIHVQSRRLSAITQYVAGMWMKKAIALVVRPSLATSRAACRTNRRELRPAIR
jgi:hypothetical protein